MEGLLRQFADRLQGADVGLFYYAGHGLQVYGQNYLAPIDAQLDEVQDLYFEAVNLGLILQLLEAAPRTSLIFLDACRDNPLARNLARSLGTGRSQSVGRGLAQVESGVGTLIAYATQPNNVAYDGTGEHSPFTAAVLEYVDEPGLEVRQMLSRVRETVIKTTDGRQVPWDHSSLTSDFYFLPETQVAARTQSGAASSLGSDVLSEIIFWQSIQGTQNPDDIRIYLEQFPEGQFSKLARSRLRALEAAAPEAAQPGTGRTEEQTAALRPEPDVARLEQRESELSRRETELQNLRAALEVQQEELADLRAQTEARREELERREAEQTERLARLERDRVALEQARERLAQQQAALADAPDPEEMARVQATLDAREQELRRRETELENEQQAVEMDRNERLAAIDEELAARQDAAEQELQQRVTGLESREQRLAEQQQQLEQMAKEVAAAREKSEAERQTQIAAAEAQLAAAAAERERLHEERAKLEAEQQQLAELRLQNQFRRQELDALAAEQAERLTQIEQDRAALEAARLQLGRREADLAGAPDPKAMAEAKAELDAREAEIERRNAELSAERQALEAERSERLAALDEELATRQRAAEQELQQRSDAIKEREQALAEQQAKIVQLGREVATAVEQDKAVRQEQLAQAQAKLAAAEAEHQRLAGERVQLEAEWARLDELRKSDDARRTQFAALEAEQAERLAQLEQDRAVLQQAQQELGERQANLADTPDPDEIAQNSAQLAAREAELRRREAELNEDQQALEAERTKQVAALDLRLEPPAGSVVDSATAAEAAPGPEEDTEPSGQQPVEREPGPPATPDVQESAEEPAAEQKPLEQDRLEVATVEPRQELEAQPEEPAVVTLEPEVDEIDAEYVALKTANVRAEPTTDSSVLAVLYTGIDVRVLGKVKGQDWYQITRPDGGIGYVHASLLEARDVQMARAEAAAAEAREAAQREAERKAAGEQQRQVREAAQREADRKAADEVARRRSELEDKRQAEEKAAAERLAAIQPQQQLEPRPEEKAPAERPGEIQLTQASILGSWCSDNVRFRLTETSWKFHMADGYEVTFPVNRYELLDDTIKVHWRDNKNLPTVTEFGQFSSDQDNLVQIRGRIEPGGDWHYYNRPFGRC
jgi:uncharacterized caspase-like protein/SH3-like domain-containing protein